MSAFGIISLNGIQHPEFSYPFNLKATIVAADAGKAVSLDTTAANTVKLATDGDTIIGRLETVEIRPIEGINVGAVSIKGGIKFPVGTSLTALDVPDIGEYLVGDDSTADGTGHVKGLATPAAGKSNWLVVEMADDDSYAIAIGI